VLLVLIMSMGGHTKNRLEPSGPQSFIFTARCTLVQSKVLRSHVVCLSVC